MQIPLETFLGTWYEQYRINSIFEPKNLTNVTATYSPQTEKNKQGQESDYIQVVNQGILVNGNQQRQRQVIGKAYPSTFEFGLFATKPKRQGQVPVKFLTLNQVVQSNFLGSSDPNTNPSQVVGDFKVLFPGSPFPGSYIVMYFGNDFMVIGTKNKNLLWLLTKQQNIDPSVLQSMYDTAKMVATRNGYTLETLDKFEKN